MRVAAEGQQVLSLGFGQSHIHLGAGEGPVPAPLKLMAELRVEQGQVQAYFVPYLLLHEVNAT